MQATRLEFHPLTYVEERDGILVGRADNESYAVLPSDGAALLSRLADGMRLPDAAEWYETTFGEPIDMADFVEILHGLGFIRAAGEQVAPPPRVRYKALGRALFSPLAWACYAGLVAACVLMMVRHPALRPSTHNVFFYPSLIAVQLILALVQMPAGLWHETFHVLAGRRLGLPTRLGVGRRLYFFVFETHLNGLLGVPRNKRYLPFLAGMLADVVLFSGLTLAAAAGLSYQPLWLGKLALAVAYLVLLRLAWQCYLFLRTDLYYVFVTALGCTNLHEATSAYLRARFGDLTRRAATTQFVRLALRTHLAALASQTGLAAFVRSGARRLGITSSPGDAKDWSPRDRAVAPWFALITLVGTAFLVAGAIVAVIPVVVEFAVRLVTGLAHGTAGGDRFWDSAVSLILAILQFCVLPLLAGHRSRAASR